MTPNESIHEFWPILILQSRYSGVYEGGHWQAWPQLASPELMPPAAHGDDVECQLFWFESKIASKVGRGDTPNDALADMFKRNDA